MNKALRTVAMLHNLKLPAAANTVPETRCFVDMQLNLRLRTGKYLLLYLNAIE